MPTEGKDVFVEAISRSPLCKAILCTLIQDVKRDEHSWKAKEWWYYRTALEELKYFNRGCFKTYSIKRNESKIAQEEAHVANESFGRALNWLDENIDSHNVSSALQRENDNTRPESNGLDIETLKNKFVKWMPNPLNTNAIQINSYNEETLFEDNDAEYLSTDKRIAYVDESGLKIANSDGTCYIIIYKGEQSRSYYKITVKDGSIISPTDAEFVKTTKDSSAREELIKLVTPDGENNELSFVDFGLNSGTLWATKNLGANAESDSGNYYAWGEVIIPVSFEYSNLRYWEEGEDPTTCLEDPYIVFNKYVSRRQNGDVDEFRELLPEDDAANHYLGGNWSTPTKEQWEELNLYCTWDCIRLDKYSVGYRVSRIVEGKNKCIYLPPTGYKHHTCLSLEGKGYYWSSTLHKQDPKYAEGFVFDGDAHGKQRMKRFCGMAIRPVINRKECDIKKQSLEASLRIIESDTGSTEDEQN